MDFQHLQPPKIELEDMNVKFSVPFRISKIKKSIRLDIQVDDESFYLIGDDPFIISYSLMKHLGDKKNLISPIDQIVLGAELGKV